MSIEVQREKDEGDIQSLQKRISELESELARVRSSEDDGISAHPVETGVEIAPIQEGEVTLRRLVQRIAMILQAEKIVIMFYDRETGELVAIPPAFGVEENKLDIFKVRATQGVSGEVFREGEPVIFHNATTDPRTQKDMVSLLHVHSGIAVPLIIEKRDEENRVVDRTTIGVLHAWNKRKGEDFNDEDVRLLERMARNVGSIIANLQLYKEIVEEREELLQTFESLVSGLILVSPESRISQINASARAIFALPIDVVGKPVTEVVRDETVANMLIQGSKGQDLPPSEISVDIADHERFFLMQGTTVRNEDSKVLGYVAILTDITEQKNIDRMKSSFVAMASHELRTPLTAIKGFVSTLLDGDKGDEFSFSIEERTEFYSIIDHECDRLTRLINDLLNTARIEANESLKPHYTKFSLDSLVKKVVTIQKQSTRRHEIKTSFETTLPDIVGDEDKLDQILTNLMNNAIKYSPEGGDIIVHAEVVGENVKIGIQDHGLGIPKEHVGKVFEKFHRVNNEDNRKIYGTGLGLFLVKHLVEQVHLGKIWVESESGVGSTFWFEIPVALDIDHAKEMND